jgi:hypothetical protein
MPVAYILSVNSKCILTIDYNSVASMATLFKLESCKDVMSVAN